MEISIVVPTFNRREIVTRTLATLFAQDFPAAGCEIIVVVDGSTDGTAEALSSLRPGCRFRVIEQENRGLAGARNTGYRAAKADLVLFLDDDMLCDPGLLGAHVAAHKEAGPVVAFGALFLSADSPSSLAAECFNREIGAFHLRRKNDPAATWQETDCVFSNSSLPRKMLEEVGGFDETFRMREDFELGVRLFSAGVQPRYIGAAIAYQYYEKTSSDLIRDAEAFAVADVMFARKHPNAQIDGQLKRLAKDPGWKRRLRMMATISPAAVDLLLAPLCGLGEAFFRVPLLRSMGVRALQMRRGIHWLHKVLELHRDALETRDTKVV
ncbi:MAG: glycosyltransferase family 2 protein [Terracidiphilus sp.]